MKVQLMFITDETIKGVHGIPQNQIELIKAYLQGAVYCWFNSNQKHDVFCARDFLGGENFFWEDTPAEALYRHYMEISEGNHDYAFSEAAKAADRLVCLSQFLKMTKESLRVSVHFSALAFE